MAFGRMSRTTPATVALSRAGVAFELHPYDYDPGADRIGMAAAEALGVPAAAVLKTLMTLVDGKAVCVVLPSDREVQMKALAAAVKGKSAEMMKPADAERITGYRVGGISPFGRRRPSPTVIEATALAQDRVFINGGQRGLLLRLDPADALRVLGAVAAAVCA
jgi:Cys-tRNA(Pro)/Cys-tRNA(Cys) deacylase